MEINIYGSDLQGAIDEITCVVKECKMSIMLIDKGETKDSNQ